MTRIDRLGLLVLLKTLADEQRLKLMGLMMQQERTGSEMAEQLQLSEPTISHHISKLHHAGLLHLRMAGNQRFYRVNLAHLAAFKTAISNIEALLTEPVMEDDAGSAWIDALDWPDADKKVLRDYTLNGRLTQLPTKEKKWLVVLRWLVTKFEAGKRYTEKEVNAILTAVHDDYATTRRSLVEYGFMRRERGGSHYWLSEDNEPSS